MRKIYPHIAFSAAFALLATGYAWGASAETANRLITEKYLSSGEASFVDGPDAEPPPWPADAQKAPPETQRVMPAASATIALNIPSSALNAISNPPAVTTPAKPSSDPTPSADAAPRMRSHPRRIVQKTVTFGTMQTGAPVTIIWN